MTTLHTKRMSRFTRAHVYLVTSRTMSAGRTTPEIISAALSAGIRLIQLREKELTKPNLISLAKRARTLTSRANALLIINDHLDVALNADADGVHLGIDDIPIAQARQQAPHLIIGASTHSIAEAVSAQQQGASYINIGPIFPTRTKQWTNEFLGLKAIPKISRAVSIPFTVMGGIKKEHVPSLRAAGAQTIAVITAITAAPNPQSAARELLQLMKTNPCSTRIRHE
jgi:thiamine-phosphate pyrophosphorylase